MNEKRIAYIKIILAMLIWGSLGIFASNIPLESSQIVLGRICLGGLFLLVVFILKGIKSPRENLKKALPVLLVSGCLMGFNWVFLFEAYRYTSVSIATIAYYMAPIIVMAASPFVLKERITFPKFVGIALAMVGIVLTAGELGGGVNPLKGFIYGLAAAFLYACVTLLNKKVSGISGIEITLLQLLGAGVVILPYALLTNTSGWEVPGGLGIICLIIIGIVHTGIALYLYFSAIQQLPGQTVALCSYIDPGSALVFSAVFLGDRLGFIEIIGAIMILGGAAFGEMKK